MELEGIRCEYKSMELGYGRLEVRAEEGCYIGSDLDCAKWRAGLSTVG